MKRLVRIKVPDDIKDVREFHGRIIPSVSFNLVSMDLAQPIAQTIPFISRLAKTGRASTFVSCSEESLDVVSLVQAKPKKTKKAKLRMRKFMVGVLCNKFTRAFINTKT